VANEYERLSQAANILVLNADNLHVMLDDSTGASQVHRIRRFFSRTTRSSRHGASDVRRV
jgi:hypothetical protein